MILAAMCAGAIVAVLFGVWVGWVSRGGDVDQAFRDGYWSRERQTLAALEHMHSEGRIIRLTDRAGWPRGDG